MGLESYGVEGYGVEHTVEENTQRGNSLNFMLTNFPDSVHRVETVPGISDHGGVPGQPTQKRQTPRSIPLYHDTHWDSLKVSALELSNRIIAACSIDHDTEEILLGVKQGLHESIASTKKMKKSGDRRLLAELRKLKRDIQQKTKTAC